MWHTETVFYWFINWPDNVVNSLVIELTHGLCQRPLYDAPLEVWYLATVLLRSLTYPLPLDSCCLLLYMTSSILALKSQAVATFTMRRGSFSARLDLWDDLLIFIMESICSLRQVLLNVFSTRWTCGILSGIKWTSLTLCCTVTHSFSLLCHQLQMKGFVLRLYVQFGEPKFLPVVCNLETLLWLVIALMHTAQFSERSWFSVVTLCVSCEVI